MLWMKFPRCLSVLTVSLILIRTFLYFLISRTREIYIGAAFGSTEMGFDIECVKDRKNFQGLCKKVLTDPEKNYIFKLSEKDQREFFTIVVDG